MKNHKQKSWTLRALGAFIVAIIIGMGTAQAASIEGTVQGFNCLTNGKVCPIDRLDPHVSIEKVFVLAGQNNGYHFLSNMDRTILARHVLEKARVTGQLNPKYKSIEADKFEVYKNGKWRVIWSKQMQQEEDHLLYF